MQIGDLVVLKSGSLPMVIQGINGLNIECVWFANGESHCANFRMEILVMIAEQEKFQILESSYYAKSN